MSCTSGTEIITVAPSHDSVEVSMDSIGTSIVMEGMMSVRLQSPTSSIRASSSSLSCMGRDVCITILGMRKLGYLLR